MPGRVQVSNKMGGGEILYCMVYGMMQYGMICCCIVWYDMILYGMVLYDVA